MRKFEEVRESSRKFEEVRESLRKFEKARGTSRKIEKARDSSVSFEKVRGKFEKVRGTSRSSTGRLLSLEKNLAIDDAGPESGVPVGIATVRKFQSGYEPSSSSSSRYRHQYWYPVVVITWVRCLGPPGPSTSQILGTFSRFSGNFLAERERGGP